MSDDATPEEQRAIQLLWIKKNPNAAPDASPDAEESSALLAEIRERMIQIEQEALRGLFQATRNQPSRSGMNSKYMQLFFLFLLAVFAVGLVVYGIQQLTTGR